MYVVSLTTSFENKFKSPSICPEYSICSKSIMIKIKGVSLFSQHAVCTGITRLSSSCQPIIFFTLARCPCAPLLSCLASSCSDFEFLCEGQRVVEEEGGWVAAATSGWVLASQEIHGRDTHGQPHALTGLLLAGEQLSLALGKTLPVGIAFSILLVLFS